jgi:hypothetical protein
MYSNFVMGFGFIFIHLTSRLASTLSCTLYHVFTQLFHYFRLNVPTFVEDNPFGTNKHITKDDVKYNTLFEKCTDKCNARFYKNTSTSIISNQHFHLFFKNILDGQMNLYINVFYGFFSILLVLVSKRCVVY